MEGTSRAHSELIEEISLLKQRIQKLEQSESELKQMEEVLQKSEKKYRALFEESFDGLFITSPGGKILDMNKKGVTMFGYDTKEEILSLDLEKDVYANPLDRKRILSLVNGQGTAEYEVMVKKKNGETMITHCSLTSVKDESGMITSYRGIIRDITERKQTEEELRESEERYRKVFQNHAAVKFLIDPDTGNIIEVNEAAVNYYGWSHEQLKQMKIQDINTLPPEDVKKEMEMTRTKKQSHFEFRHRRADGSIRDVEVFSSNIKLKGRDFLHSIIHDITDRKQAEEKLKVSEDKYHSIFENAVEGIFQTTPEGRYISVNPALARMKGYDTPEELMKGVNDISKQTYVNPDDRVRYKNILEENGIVQGFETQHYRKDGSIIWVSINSRIVRDPAGRALYYEGTIEDITTRKIADEKFKENAEKLRKVLSGTIKALSMMVEARDPYTAGHQRKVSDLACAIAQDMALPDDTINNIRIAGTIHDIGKISIPAEILSKPGALTDIEFSLIKVHPQAGYDILKDIELPYPIAEIVLQHHERLDGSGYPQGLTNDRILIESRIIAVADVIEAMASHRPYRPGCGINPTLEEIEKDKGTLYDKKVVEVCVRLFREKGFNFE